MTTTLRRPEPAPPCEASQVLDHDSARNLTFRWFDVSPRKQDVFPREKCVETSLLSLERDGTQLGRLSISFTTDELLAAHMPRPLAYLDHHRGWCLGYRPGAVPERRSLWEAAHRYAHRTPTSMRATAGVRFWTLREEDAPADEDVYEADLQAIEAQYADEIERWKAWFRVPFVAYSYIEEFDHGPAGARALRRTGIGTAMYLAAARHLAQTGRALAASGTQSAEAQRLWQRLEAAGHPIRRIEMPGPYDNEPATRTLLDFRTV